MKLVKRLAIGVAAVLLTGAAFIYFGLIPPGADQPHSALVYQLLESTRERGIAVRAKGIAVPALDDPALIRSGAGNYNAMCSGCHLMPGVKESELSKGLYPVPPPLADVDDLKPAEAFWVIKHGIKSSGMPAWGKSMDDGYIWGLVAFVMKLPTLSEQQYKTEVACSGGHSHGGSVTVEHEHEDPAIDCGQGVEKVGPADHAKHDAAEPARPDEHHDHTAMSATMADAASAKKHRPDPAAGHDHSGASGMDHSKMQGMDHPSMASTDHSATAGLDHSVMGHGAGIATKSLPIRNGAEAAVQSFQDALQVGNRNLALQWLDPEARIEAGAHGENSRSEYASGRLQSDIDFLKSARIYPQRRSSWVSRDSATVKTQTRIVAEADGNAIDTLSNEVATLRKTRDGWRIVRVERTTTAGDQSAPAHH